MKRKEINLLVLFSSIVAIFALLAATVLAQCFWTGT